MPSHDAALIAVDGPFKGLYFQLEGHATDDIVVGRGQGGALRLSDDRTSRKHARFFFDACWYVEDLLSRNGTFVNDVRIQKPTPLNQGDLVTVGHSIFRFTIEQPRTVVAPITSRVPDPSDNDATLAAATPPMEDVEPDEPVVLEPTVAPPPTIAETEPVIEAAPIKDAQADFTSGEEVRGDAPSDEPGDSLRISPEADEDAPHGEETDALPLLSEDEDLSIDDAPSAEPDDAIPVAHTYVEAPSTPANSNGDADSDDNGAAREVIDEDDARTVPRAQGDADVSDQVDALALESDDLDGPLSLPRSLPSRMSCLDGGDERVAREPVKDADAATTPKSMESPGTSDQTAVEPERDEPIRSAKPAPPTSPRVASANVPTARVSEARTLKAKTETSSAASTPSAAPRLATTERMNPQPVEEPPAPAVRDAEPAEVVEPARPAVEQHAIKPSPAADAATNPQAAPPEPVQHAAPQPTAGDTTGEKTAREWASAIELEIKRRDAELAAEQAKKE